MIGLCPTPRQGAVEEGRPIFRTALEGLQRDVAHGNGVMLGIHLWVVNVGELRESGRVRAIYMSNKRAVLTQPSVGGNWVVRQRSANGHVAGQHGHQG